MANSESTHVQTNTSYASESNQPPHLRQSQTLEFDPMVSQLTQEEKDAFLKRFTGSKINIARTIIGTVLLSVLFLILLFIVLVTLFATEVITRKTIVVSTIGLIVVWIALTVAAAWLVSRRTKRYIHKLEYKKQVMFITRNLDLTLFSPIFITVSVWEYISSHPEQVTYNFCNKTLLSKDVKAGDLIFRYSNTLDNSKYSLNYFVSQPK